MLFRSDFAVALAPSDIFDDDLGPTMIVEKSPLEMLREKLDAVREDVSSAVKELQGNQQSQPTEQLDEVAGSSVTNQPDTAQMSNPDAPQFTEKSGREGTEIAQQTADLEDQFPEEEFMDQSNISRKHVKGAGGQVMQVVENVYEEADGKKLDEKHGEMPAAFKKNAEKMKAKAKGGKEDSGKDGEMPDFIKKKIEAKKGSADHAELEYDEVSYKTNPAPGVVKFGKKSEPSDDDDTGRYETARSAENGYVDRMQTGKAGAGAETGRFKTAKNSNQDSDRMHTADNGEQDADRMHTAKAGMQDADGESRWAGQADAYDQVSNMDQYDAGASDYGVNAPKTSDGSDPYGRDETETKMPTESEEMPDDEVFAVQTTNVMSDKNMRVIRQKSSDARPQSVGTHNLLYAEIGRAHV